MEGDNPDSRSPLATAEELAERVSREELVTQLWEVATRARAAHALVGLSYPLDPRGVNAVHAAVRQAEVLVRWLQPAASGAGDASVPGEHVAAEVGSVADDADGQGITGVDGEVFTVGEGDDEERVVGAGALGGDDAVHALDVTDDASQGGVADTPGAVVEMVEEVRQDAAGGDRRAVGPGPSDVEDLTAVDDPHAHDGSVEIPILVRICWTVDWKQAGP